jgi:hypothetical protein
MNRRLSGLQIVCCPDLPPICNKVLNAQHKAGCFIKASATKIPFRDNTFDIVSTVTVLQHINRESQEEALSEIERVNLLPFLLLQLLIILL